MTPRPARKTGAVWRRRAGTVGLVLALLACGVASSWPTVASAQGASGTTRAAVKLAPEQGVRWNDLKPAQQITLKPLEREWAVISSAHKQKWLELVKRFPSMTPAEQTRVHERMAEWARLTPLERSQARLNFQEAKQLSVQDRQQRWNAYQALSPEQRQQLAARAVPASAAEAKPLPPAAVRADKSTREAPQAKSNIVPNPALAAPPKPVGAGVVQARPGATTTLITKRPAPPSHQQTGLPKIAATPEFVNKATLLPQRGPQGAATRSAAASSVAPSPAQ